MYNFFSQRGDQNAEYDKLKSVRTVRTAVISFVTEKDTEKEDIEYLNLLSILEGFLVEETDLQVVRYVASTVVDKIYEYIPKISKSILSLIQTLRILTKIDKHSGKIPPVTIFNLFISVRDFSVQQKQLISLGIQYFTILFANPNFSLTFIERNGLSTILHKIICNNIINEDIQKFIFHILRFFGSQRPNQFASLLSEFVQVVQSKSIPCGNEYFASYFISKLFQQFSEQLSGFSKQIVASGALTALQVLFKKLDNSQIQQILFILINSKGDELRTEPNMTICNWLSQICSQFSSDFHDITFSLIMPFISNNNSQIELLDKNFPIVLWFTEYQRPISEIILILKAINQCCPKIVKNFIPDIFRVLNESYELVFNIVENQISNNFINYEDLAKFGFLDTFIINVPKETVCALFSVKSFPGICLNVFLTVSPEVQMLTFTAILDSNLSFDANVPFLIEAPTSANVKALINYKKNVEKVIQIFLLSFDQSLEVCSQFIGSGGLSQWLINLDFSYFVPILGSLVVRKRYREVDDFIASLPKNHELFALPSSELEKIVYGMNRMVFRAIRVPSLFHLISSSTTASAVLSTSTSAALPYIDPYNAYVLGTSDYASSGYDCPLITQIGNRYIKPQFINMLLSRPYEIGKFCDCELDHFPLFQFFRGCDALIFKKEYKAISFWIKFHQTFDTLFFSTDQLKLSLKGKFIAVSTDEKVINVEIDPEKWNHVFIYLESTIRNYKILVRINKNDEVRTNKAISDKFKTASFEYSDTGLMFIGSSIRLYDNQYPEIGAIFQKGPGWLDPVSEKDLMLTPYYFRQNAHRGERRAKNLYATQCNPISIPPNCYSVPYFGFPFHFISQKRLTDLFIFLDNSRTNEQFDSIFHTLLSINKITVRNTSTFWMRMLRSMKNTNFITKNIFHNAVELMSGLKNDEWTLSSILFDSEMWKYVNNELLVDILFDDFKNFAFSNIPEFELFLSTIILQNPKSVKIISTIFENSQQLEKLVEWIITFLGSAHCLDSPSISWESMLARCDMTVQHTIIDGLILFLNKNSVKLVTNKLPFRILNGLLTVSIKPLAAHFFDLMTEIEKIYSGFIDVNDTLITSIAPLAAFPNVWMRVFELHEINAKFLPLLLSLIWATSVSVVNALSTTDKCERYVTKNLDKYEKGLNLANNSVNSILQSKKCRMILAYWFPLICNYPVLFQMFTNKSGASDNYHLGASRLSELSEPINLSRDIHSTEAPEPPKPQSSPNFMLDLVSSVLSSFGFETPKSNSVVKGGSAMEWLKSSTLSFLITNILFSANQKQFQLLFAPLFLSVPLFHRNRGTFFIPVLSSCILQRMNNSFPYMETLLDYLIFCTAEKCFMKTGALLLEDLLTSLRRTNTKQQLGAEFVNLFLGLVSYCDRSAYPSIISTLFSNLIEFAEIITVTDSQLPFFYALHIISKERPNNFRPFVSKISTRFTCSRDQNIIGLIETLTMGPNSSYFSIIEKAFQQRLEKFTEIRDKIEHEIINTKFVTEIQIVSKAVTTEKYETNCKFFKDAVNYKKKLKILDSTFMLIGEKMQWERFMTAIHDTAISESSFAPKCFHLSPRCLRLMSPQVLTPSPFAPFLEKKKSKKKDSSFAAVLYNRPQTAVSDTIRRCTSTQSKMKITNSSKTNNESSLLMTMMMTENDSFRTDDDEDLKRKPKSFDNSQQQFQQQQYQLIQQEYQQQCQQSKNSSDAKNRYYQAASSVRDIPNFWTDPIITENIFTNNGNNINSNMNNVNVNNGNTEADKISSFNRIDYDNNSFNYNLGNNNENENDIQKKQVSTYSALYVHDPSSYENDFNKLFTDQQNNNYAKNENQRTVRFDDKQPFHSFDNLPIVEEEIKENNNDDNENNCNNNNNNSNNNANNYNNNVNNYNNNGNNYNNNSNDYNNNDNYCNEDNEDNDYNGSNDNSDNIENYNNWNNNKKDVENNCTENTIFNNKAQPNNVGGIIRETRSLDSSVELKKMSAAHQDEGAQISSSSSSSTAFTSDIIWQYRHHIKSLFVDSKPPNSTFFSLFYSMFGKNELQFHAECFLKRHSIRIPSVMFFYPKCLLILTYARKTNDDINLIKVNENKQLHMFLESIYLGHWGETHLFASHIVINIPISSLICIQNQKMTDSFEIWSFMSGHFIIEVIAKYLYDFRKEMNKVQEKVSGEFPNDLLLPNNSPEAMILLKNDESGRSFADLSAYPFFPSFNRKRDCNQKVSDFPNAQKTEEMLSSVLPFAYSAHHLQDETNCESVPANFYFTSEFLMKGPLFGLKSIQIHNSNMKGNMQPRRFSDNKEKSWHQQYKMIQGNKSISFKKSALDFSESIQKVMRLKKGLQDSSFVEDWVVRHFPENAQLKVSNINNLYWNNVRSSSLSNVSSNSNHENNINSNISIISNISNNDDINSYSNNSFNYININNNSSISAKNNFCNKTTSYLDSVIYCQKLKKRTNKHSTIMFTSNEITKAPILSSKIGNYGSVKISQKDLCLILHYLNRSVQKVTLIPDHYFTFASSIDVSNNGLFLSVDFEFGLTRVWRIKYCSDSKFSTVRYPCNIEQLSDFSWSTDPTSLLSGTHFICATKLECDVVLWEINSGTLHRILKFGVPVTAIAMDDEFGGIWIATSNGYGYFYSINGQRWAEIELNNNENGEMKITAMIAVPQNYSVAERIVVCGCENGDLFIGTPRIENGTIDIRRLPSEHSAPITKISLAKYPLNFISCDKNGNVYLWSAKGPRHLQLKEYEKCALCENEPTHFCSACKRAICSRCDRENLCLMCIAHENFVC